MGNVVKTSNCEDYDSFIFTILINGTEDSAFQATITNSLNNPTMDIMPTNAFVYENNIITIQAKLSKYGSIVIDTSYVFNLHTNLP